MTEIPEHLRKRAEEARQKAEAAQGAGGGEESAAPAGGGESGGEAGGGGESAGRIPPELLERSKAARERSGGAAPATAEAAPAGGGTAVATAPATPAATGPGGHTQRLLTVVKSGSIQDVRATPVDKVHVWPHLLVIEFVAALAVTAF